MQCGRRQPLCSKGCSYLQGLVELPLLFGEAPETFTWLQAPPAPSKKSVLIPKYLPLFSDTPPIKWRDMMHNLLEGGTTC
jgi:hypothetical protein